MSNVAPLHAYQQRVVDERAALDENIAKLSAFQQTLVFTSLSADEQLRMNQQLYHMREYSRILGERIGAFNK
jgi:hypothetical protein